MAGAWVVLAEGRPALYVAANRRHLLTFRATAGEDDRRALAAAFAALPALPQGKRRRLLVIESVDGVPVAESPHQGLLIEAGFCRDYRGLVAEKRHA
jgi:ATP-dependent Lhr-like helicase